MSSITTLFGNNDALANLIEARQQRLAGTHMTTAPKTAEALKKTISNSTRLDKGSKQVLTQLTNSVSQFAAGNTKLLRDIAGISNILQMGAKEDLNSNATGPYAQLLGSYYNSKYPPSKFKIDA